MSLDLSASAMIPAGNGEQGWDDRMTINVLLVDDHALFRAGIASLLSPHTDVRVVGEAQDGQEAAIVGQAGQHGRITVATNMVVKSARTVRLGPAGPSGGSMNVRSRMAQ